MQPPAEQQGVHIRAFRPCLLIPVYNHGAQLPRTLAWLADKDLPCLLVNDGSDDATRAVIDQLCEQYDWVQARHLSVNQGKGVAVLEGVRWARSCAYTHALQIDADGQHDANDIPALLDLARQHPHALISGQPRYDQSVPKSRLYGRYITHFWVWIETLSFAIKDSMCGFRVYPVDETLACAEKYDIGQRMDFDTDMMVKMYWEGVPSYFLPTRVIYPEDGLSHFAVWRDNLRIFRMHTLLVLGMIPRLPSLLRNRHKLASVNHDVPWHSRQERGAYWGMKVSLYTYRYLGKRIMGLLLKAIVLYFFIFGGSARRASQDFLRRVYVFSNDHAALQTVPGLWDSYRHFLSFSEALVDRVSAWSGEMGVADFDFPDREKLRAYPKGVVLLSSHLGNMDMCRALTNHSRGKKINVLLHTEGAPAMNRLMREVNPASQVELISVREVSPATAILLQEKIDAGEWVIIAVDRVAPDNPGRVSSIEFMGEPAVLPQGGFVLAALLQCPVYAVFCLKQAGRYKISVECLAEHIPFQRKQRQEALESVIGQYARLLEHYACRFPYQWYNFFNFWSSRSTP